VFVGEFEDHGLIADIVPADCVLGYDAVFVFNFYRHGLIGKQGFSFFENACELGCLDPMVVILAHSDLELAGGGFAQGAATIEEGFADPTDFGDVEGNRDGIAIGKLDAENAPRIFGEE